MIRIQVASLAILFAMSASAQVVSPIEQSYGPYDRPAGGFEPALAVANNAILLAWSEVMPTGLTQIRTGLLDFHGRLVSPIFTIETTINATAPKVIYDGAALRVEYTEGDARLAVDIDANGAPTGSPQLAPPPGSVLRASFSPPVCWPRPCSTPPFLSLSWSGPGVHGTYIYQTSEKVGPIAAGQRGDHVVLAWHSPGAIGLADILGTVRNIGRHPAPISNLNELPAVGCDDTHCLVAFTTSNRQIHGLIIDKAQAGHSGTFPIETNSRVDRPQVHAPRNGRFLVVYTSAATAPSNRFAGRIVTTEPVPRRRAVR